MEHFSLRQIHLHDPLAKKCAELVRIYSWGAKYPVDPWSEMKESKYIIGCFDGETLAGFANITRVASPDGKDNGKPWLADAVVLPEYQGRGIYNVLYEKCMEFLKGEKEIFACTGTSLMEGFLLKRGWIVDRRTKDEEGGDCKVFKIDNE